MKPEGFTAPKFSWRNGGWPQPRKKGHRHTSIPHKLRRSIRRRDSEAYAMKLDAQALKLGAFA